MDPNIRPQPLPSLSVAFNDVKSAGSTLLEAYVSEGMKDAMDTAGRVALAKFAVIALSALAVGLSLYGLIFETIALGFTLVWADSTPEIARMGSHAVIVVFFGLVALLLWKKEKENA